MLNQTQARSLWQRFRQSSLFDDAELAIGATIENDNAPRFLAAWATALSNGAVDPLLSEMAEVVSASGGIAPSKTEIPVVPAGIIEYPAKLQRRHPEPKRWVSWDDHRRQRYLDQQTDEATFAKAKPIPEAAAAIGVTPWVLYGAADASRVECPAKLFVRFGSKLGVLVASYGDLKKLFGDEKGGSK